MGRVEAGPAIQSEHFDVLLNHLSSFRVVKGVLVQDQQPAGCFMNTAGIARAVECFLYLPLQQSRFYRSSHGTTGKSLSERVHHAIDCTKCTSSCSYQEKAGEAAH